MFYERRQAETMLEMALLQEELNAANKELQKANRPRFIQDIMKKFS